MLVGFGVFFILPICDADNFSFLSEAPLSDYLVEGRFSKLRKSAYPNYAMATVMKIICIFADFDFDQFALGCDSVTILDVWSVVGVMVLVATVLIWYLSHVLPWTNATPQSPFFPLLPSYWCPRPVKMDSETEGEPLPADRFEAPPKTPAVMECKNLVKYFGSLMALDGVNMSVHKSQVTVLLGHNGAGKTTLMSILTGLIQPSGGSARVAGWDINTEAARREVGFCPQKDIFFDDLTVQEHLEYFANLLILDEPTAAMDPETRRHFWKLIGRFRGHRTVLISTHDMEEADALGDRIIIMHSGKVICNGSTNFLKIACGVGYKLNVGKAKQGFQIDGVLQLVRQAAPLAAVEDERIGDVTIALHTFSCEGFENMFRQLESGAPRLGITGVGVTVSTMTDAYLKVSNEWAAELRRQQKKEDKGTSKPQSPTSLKGGAKVAAPISKPTSPAGAATTGKVQVPTSPKDGANVAAPLSKPTSPAVAAITGALPMTTPPPGPTNAAAATTKLVSPAAPATAGAPAVPAEIAAHLGAVAIMPATPATPGILGRNLILVPRKPKFKVSRRPDCTQQFCALLGKRWCYLGRTRFLFLTGWLLPVAIAYVATTTLTARRAVDDDVGPLPRIVELSATAQLGDNVRAFVNNLNETHSSLIYQQFLRSEAIAIDSLEDPEEEMLAALEDNYIGYAESYAFGATFNSSSIIEAWYNPTSLMSLPVLNNLLHTVQLRNVSGRRDLRITTDLSLYALPKDVLRATSVRRRHEEALALLQLAVEQTWIYWGCMATISIGLIISSFVIFPAAENHSGARGLQLMTGVSGCTFISAHFLFDLTFYLVPMVVIYGMFAVLQRLSYLTIVALTSIVLAFAPLGILLPYMVTEHIETEGTAYSIVVGTFAVGGPAVFLFYMTSLPTLNSQVLRVPLLFFPPFLLGSTTIQAVSLEYEGNMCELLRMRPKLDDLIVSVCEDTHLLGSGICFGLVGVNGAGKTTTFQMLAALIEMTDGNAYMKKLVLSKAPRQWQANIGYCPQSDALLGKLNAFETLFMFGRLRGVPERPLAAIVSKLIAMVDLSEHAAKPCEYYSGGNKRKLSIAVAVVGFPPVVLLDEPFAGVDVVSRNHIRQALVKLKSSTNTAFILTSHNMEECEVSCDRIGIMVKGQMTCLGPLHHLRQKFGGGLTLKFRLPDDSPVEIEQVDKAVFGAFPGAKRLDTQDRLEKVAEYRLQERPAWSLLFQKVSALRSAFTFEHVIAADANLEQLLVAFARKAREEAKLEPKDED
ncbi:hypothetical protein HPB50_023733 [Hyalomma asiaticum]|uniref:Uncharacterized protein n=1 Tax=Hyalomma asiaticum TaxID=266040 RepID=A0ACB7SSD5_HYAAI|nr:hypothetical protein HPB50_023733 [Hyalomma asiaticum]